MWSGRSLRSLRSVQSSVKSSFHQRRRRRRWRRGGDTSWIQHFPCRRSKTIRAVDGCGHMTNLYERPSWFIPTGWIKTTAAVLLETPLFCIIQSSPLNTSRRRALASRWAAVVMHHTDCYNRHRVMTSATRLAQVVNQHILRRNVRENKFTDRDDGAKSARQTGSYCPQTRGRFMSNHLVTDGGTGSAPDVDGAAGTVKPRGFVMWEKDFTWCIQMNEDKKPKTSVKRKITGSPQKISETDGGRLFVRQMSAITRHRPSGLLFYFNVHHSVAHIPVVTHSCSPLLIVSHLMTKSWNCCWCFCHHWINS